MRNSASLRAHGSFASGMQRAMPSHPAIPVHMEPQHWQRGLPHRTQGPCGCYRRAGSAPCSCQGSGDHTARQRCLWNSGALVHGHSYHRRAWRTRLLFAMVVMRPCRGTSEGSERVWDPHSSVSLQRLSHIICRSGGTPNPARHPGSRSLAFSTSCPGIHCSRERRNMSLEWGTSGTRWQ